MLGWGLREARPWCWEEARARQKPRGLFFQGHPSGPQGPGGDYGPSLSDPHGERTPLPHSTKHLLIRPQRVGPKMAIFVLSLIHI